MKFAPSASGSKFATPSRNRNGFTLVEILAVLAVIAGVLAVGVPAIAKVLQDSRVRNAEGVASVAKSAITQFLSKPGSIGTLPVTETAGGTLPANQFSNSAANTAAASKAATLDNVLLTEGLLERPLGLRLGAQNATSGAGPLVWSSPAELFSNATPPTADFTPVSRVECGVSDGATNPGVTGNNSSNCAFNLNGDGATFIPSGSRVAYMIIKGVPDGDAYQLALDVDGASLLSNLSTSPATNDQTKGPVVYQKDSGGGTVDIYYYLTNL